jgi:alkylhydroperoxidase family enzyme
MVRLRNARFQDCHFCQSTRSPAARARGADENLYAAIDSYEDSGLLDERQKAALRFADAFLITPAETPTSLLETAAEHFTARQLVELALRLVAYSSDKVMVALRLDLDRPLTAAELAS